jgi:hypothetical protein
MNVISTSYGNDSIALIQYAHEEGLEDVTTVYCDTGWAAPCWEKRIKEGEKLAKEYGFKTVRVESMGMAELIRIKKGWPGNAQQFCTGHLKGIPFLQWIDDVDPDNKAIVLIGKRRAESKARADTKEFVESSEYHGGRTVWHPLFKHTDEQRDELVKRTCMELLSHRSQECSPCVNANRGDFMLLTQDQIEMVNELEVEIGKPMFRPKRFGAIGIYGVMVWAKHGRKRGGFLDPLEDEGCGSPFGCGL